MNVRGQYWMKRANVAYTPDQLHQAILYHVKNDGDCDSVAL